MYKDHGLDGLRKIEEVIDNYAIIKAIINDELVIDFDSDVPQPTLYDKDKWDSGTSPDDDEWEDK